MIKTFQEALIIPIRSLRLKYLPLLMIYFAYGASTFSGIAESIWVKEHLDLSAEALLVIGFWVSLPWTIKMVFGQMVDSLPLFHSARRSYIFIAAVLIASGSLLLAGMAGEWPAVVALGSQRSLYLIASLLTMTGLVLQDVVADAMTVEVVDRTECVSGQMLPRPSAHIQKDLAMVQLLGRLAMNVALFLVAGLGGWLAQILSYQTMFLLTLFIPIISISGSLLIQLKAPLVKPINWSVLGGGILYGFFIIAMAASSFAYSQEVIFMVSMIIVILLTKSVITELPRDLVRSILCAGIVIFMYRATPTVGPSLTWWYLDELKFDKAFLGTLSQIGAGLAILGMWFGAKLLTEKPIRTVLLWLTIITFLVGLPSIFMFYGLHLWTERVLGFGARTIAFVDTALSSPFAQLSMIPLLALIAIHAPKGNAATWFALMASFMNLALSAGTLMSKYLNQIWIVTREVRKGTGEIMIRADYSELGELMIVVSLLTLLLPLVAIWVFMPKGTLQNAAENTPFTTRQ
ncbi:MAG: hypothetical protein HY559_06400 [Gammaproteobacteria bacterium]|nr:hypothetical protein [Gammaproteobacteria bacterium]